MKNVFWNVCLAIFVMKMLGAVSVVLMEYSQTATSVGEVNLAGTRIVGVGFASNNRTDWGEDLVIATTDKAGQFSCHVIPSRFVRKVTADLSPEDPVSVVWSEEDGHNKINVRLHSLSEIGPLGENKVWQLKVVEPLPIGPNPAGEDPPVRVYEYGESQYQEGSPPPPINNKSKVD